MRRRFPPLQAAGDVPSGSSGIGAPLNVDSTIAQIVEYYLEVRRGEVKSQSWITYYTQCLPYVVGPLLLGSPRERYVYARYGRKSETAQLLPMLGCIKLSELTTAMIRHWHRTLTSHVGSYTAKTAKKQLRSALALAAEDFELRIPVMPAQRGRGTPKRLKRILTPAEIGLLLKAAQADRHKGIYYAFPFLTGVRPGELLALHWEDVDFDAGLIRIHRTQLLDGVLSDLTKTAAGTRQVPMSSLLRSLLVDWKRICPIGQGDRVFPCLGNTSYRGHKKRGTPLSYANFILVYWRPVFRTLGLPYVTPHSARHAFISTLQASGVEIGVVAKLAGHADPAITLSHYTQSVRDGSGAVIALEATYCRSPGRDAIGDNRSALLSSPDTLSACQPATDIVRQSPPVSDVDRHSRT
jgi:integrase